MTGEEKIREKAVGLLREIRRQAHDIGWSNRSAQKRGGADWPTRDALNDSRLGAEVLQLEDDELLALLPTEGEPVAWLLQADYAETGEWKTSDWTDDPEFRDRWLSDDKFGPGRAVPLFTTPQESAEVELWECPDCAFGFDIGHEDVEGGWSCPVCAEERLETEVKRLRSALERMECRCLPHAKPGDGQCDRCAALNTETDGR